MGRRHLLVIGLCTLPALADAQADRVRGRYEPMRSGPGWEAFALVTYVGGHGRIPESQHGLALILTDSTVDLRKCRDETCAVGRAGAWWVDPPLFSVPLASLTAVERRTRLREGPLAGAMNPLGGGSLGLGEAEEIVLLVFDADDTAEAPLFLVGPGQSAALEAKIRFRLRKMGRALP
jgi:hypothetical protein